MSSEFQAAWARFTDAQWKAKGDLPATAQSRLDERLLSEGLAMSRADAAVKLRYALWCNTGERWLEAAALGASVPKMAELLDIDDTVNQVLWSTIQSLEAMEAANG